MKKIIAILSVALFLTYSSTALATSVLFPYQGGTGSSSTPASGQIPIGTSAGIYSPAYLTAGTNITISTSTGAITINSSGGGGSGSVSTSTPITAFTFPFWQTTAGALNGSSSIFYSAGSIGIGTPAPSSTLHVIGTFRSSGINTFDASIKASSTLEVTGATQLASLNAGATTLTTLSATTGTFSGAVKASSTLEVTGSSQLSGINGGATTLTTLSATTGTFSGALRASSTLDVTGSAIFGSTLQSGNANILGTLTASGAVKASSTLDVTGAVILGSTLQSGNANILGTLTVSGAVKASSTIDVTGAAIFGSTLQSGNNNTLGTLTVFGAVKASSTVQVTGNTQLANVSSTNEYISSQLTLPAVTGTQCLHAVGGLVSGTGSDCGSGGGSVAGANTQVQWNNAGSFGADSNFTYTSSTNVIYGKYLSASLGTVSAPGFIFTGDTNTGIWSSGADTLNVSTGGAEALRVTSGQLVGIGTTAPSSTLHVVGNLFVDGFTRLTVASTSISDLYGGPSIFANDSGQVTWIDMPVTSDSAAGTVESIRANIDGNTILTLYSQADGSGGVATSSLLIASTTAPLVNQKSVIYGHAAYGAQTVAPSVSSCGTSPSIASGSSDARGIVNVGSVTATACTVTFAQPMANPVCVISDDSTAVTPGLTSLSTTGFTAGFSISLAGGHLYYHCDDMR